MFKVKRSKKPDDWQNNNYRDMKVVSQLEKDFFGKCYLCEQKDFGNVNVEHLIPHKGINNDLRVDWNNLYYSCSHCNGIKGSRYEEILDCCVENHNVDTAIALEVPTLINGKVKITNTLSSESALYERTLNTIHLLDQCYNNSNNGTQSISHSYLIEKIMDEYSYLLSLRFKLIKNHERNTDDENKILVDKINNMMRDNYPFSAFWKNCVKNDNSLKKLNFF